jgi:hypothetical protein
MEERRGYDRMLEDKFDMMEKLFVEKLEHLHSNQVQILEQVKKTNGRVTKLEDETVVVRLIGRNRKIVFVLLAMALGVGADQGIEILMSLLL